MDAPKGDARDYTVLDKPYAEKMGLVSRQRSGRRGRVVRGIGPVTLLRTDRGARPLPLPAARQGGRPPDRERPRASCWWSARGAASPRRWRCSIAGTPAWRTWGWCAATTRRRSFRWRWRCDSGKARRSGCAGRTSLLTSARYRRGSDRGGWRVRHSCASPPLARHVTPKVVRGLLGHSQIAMTLAIYSHLPPAAQRGATARMDSVLGGHERGRIGRRQKEGKRSRGERRAIGGPALYIRCSSWEGRWLGCRDSNPNFLIQSQTSYR